MAWGNTTLVKKFIRYAQQYADWAKVSEVSRPVPRTTAARVEAPFFDQEVFLDKYNWWIASEYEMSMPVLNAPPRHLGPVDLPEADLMLMVAHDYLTSLAGALGSRNELLVPAEFQGLSEKEGDRPARIRAFAEVLNYLTVVSNGVAHRSSRTQQMARELLRIARPTLSEFHHGTNQPSAHRSPDNPAAPAQKVVESRKRAVRDLIDVCVAMSDHDGKIDGGALFDEHQAPIGGHVLISAGTRLDVFASAATRTWQCRIVLVGSGHPLISSELPIDEAAEIVVATALELALRFLIAVWNDDMDDLPSFRPLSTSRNYIRPVELFPELTTGPATLALGDAIGNIARILTNASDGGDDTHDAMKAANYQGTMDSWCHSIRSTSRLELMRFAERF